LVSNKVELRKAQEAAHVGTFRLAAPSCEPVSWSEECYRIVGLDSNCPLPSRAEFMSRVVVPAHREESRRLMQECASEGTPFEYEYRIDRPDGEARWVCSKGAPVVEDGLSRTGESFRFEERSMTSPIAKRLN